MDSSASAAAASSPEDLLSKTLTRNDATEVTRELLEINPKNTEFFGSLLKIPKATINSIHFEYKDPQGRLFHLLDEFAKQVEPRPTWRVILGALRDPLMGEHSLAQSIEDSLSPLSPATTPAATPLGTQYTHSKRGRQVRRLSSPAIPGGPGKGSKSQLLKPKTDPKFPRQLQPHGKPKSTARTQPSLPAQPSTRSLVSASRSPGLPKSSKRKPPPNTDSVVRSPPHQTEQPCMYSITEIKEYIKILEKKFKALQETAVGELEVKKVQIEHFVHELTVLPACEQSEHEKFFDKHLDDLEKCTRYRPLFSRLNRHWNYLSPQLLNHLIDRILETATARKEMVSYNSQLGMFRSQTLLGRFCEIDCQHIEPPVDVSTIKATFDEKHVPKGPTLQDVEDFRWRYTRHYKLREFALMLAACKTGSFLVSFVVPNSILELLKRDVPTAILEEFGITQLEVAGYCVFSTSLITPALEPALTEGDSKESAPLSAVPALPTAGGKARSQGPVPVMLDYVQIRLLGFGEWFEHLKKLTVRNCEEDQVSVPRLAALVKQLPASRTAAVVPFLDDVFDDLELLNTPTEVFIALRVHLKYYAWYRLLGVIIDTLNLRGVKKEMSNFRESLHELFVQFSVIDFIQAEQGKRVRPPNHSELVADFDWDEGVSLNWIDLFQQHYLDFYNLHHYVMLLGSVQLQDHFTVTWFVPDALTKDLKAALPYNLLTHFATFSLTIGGDAIYVNHGKDMESSLPKDDAPFDPEPDTSSGVPSDADKKASTTTAGAEKEYSFLEAPPKDFFCPVMFSLLLEPHQTSCCGKHLSTDAVSKISGKCPMCKMEEFSTTLDKHFQRQVQELLVFCPYRMRGCGFVAEIAEMERHVLQCSHSFASKPLGTETLGTQNAALIKRELRPAQKMAYELGLALKVRRLTVTDDHTELLSQVVDEFLQLSAPTWATIVEALRSPAVKCDKLATEVEKRFCTEPPTGPAKDDPKQQNMDETMLSTEQDLLLPHCVVNPTGVVLGLGAYGEVVEVTYNDKHYAAKKLHKKESADNFTREIEIMSRVKHHNIVRYYSLCKLARTKEMVIVMEKLDATLSAFLGSKPDMELSEKMPIFFDIVRGLRYLHNQDPAIIHRDVTADNVLLDREKTAKICDFGNSRAVDLTGKSGPLTLNPGTPDYMAPEALDRGDYDEKVDIFAFGHLAIHIVLQRRAYPLLHTKYQIGGRLAARSEVERRGEYLKSVEEMLGADHLLHGLIMKCLHDVSSRRPSCEEIMSDLATVDVDRRHLLDNAVVHPTGVVLGGGAYGDVLEVEYKGRLYAAKKHRIGSSPMYIGALSREHEIFTRIQHPNIVPYYGVCKLSTDKSTVLVMERMDKNLDSFLKESPNVSLVTKIAVLNDVAKGMHHLHSRSPAIIHRDITAGNVLLDSNGTAKVSDFGNSRMIDLRATPEIFTSNPGTLDYMSPEAFEGGSYDTKLDVFSFGHLSIHVIIRHRPHKLLRHTYKVAGKLMAGKFIPRSEVERRRKYLEEMSSILGGVNEHPLYDLTIRCLNDDPDARPTFAEILQRSPFSELNY